MDVHRQPGTRMISTSESHYRVLRLLLPLTRIHDSVGDKTDF